MYYWYDQDGKILQTATGLTPQEALDNPLSASYTLAEDKGMSMAKAADIYLHNGKIKLKPKNFDPRLRWSSKNKKWEDLRNIEDARAMAIKRAQDSIVTIGGNSYSKQQINELTNQLVLMDLKDTYEVNGSLLTYAQLRALLKSISVERLRKKNLAIQATTLAELDEV